MSTKVLGDLPAGASGEDIERNLQDITRAINGNDTNGIPFNLIQHDSDTTYALSVSNIEATVSPTINLYTQGDAQHIIMNKTVGLAFKGTTGFTGNVTITGTLGVTGATTLQSTLAVTGATTLSSTLAVTDDVTIGSSKVVIDAQTGNVVVNTNKVSIDGATGAQTNAGAFTAALGTLTSDANCIAATATWTNAATYTGAIKVVITDTSSNAASKLMDLFVGSTSMFSIRKDGLITTTGQIAFPATQNASGDANTLDDYEESTWTPTDASGAGLSLTVTSATYTKIGRMVHLQAYITYPVTASGANASIGGLPFTVANQNYATFVSDEATMAFLQVVGGTTTLIPRAAAAALTNLTNATLSGNFIVLTATYQV